MVRLRILIFLVTLIIVGSVGYFASLYARGYRLNLQTLKFEPNGILVLRSDPSGAQVFINGYFRTATDTTLSLSPGNYDVTVIKEGYATWQKRINVEKEVVSQATASLFKTVPSLTAVTYLGVSSPVPSSDFTKIAYIVPLTKETGSDKAGLWVMDTFNLPLGFPRDPRRITDGDLKDATYEFSPNAGQILVTTPTGVFLIDTGGFTSQAQRVNLLSRKDQILADWQKEKETRLESQINSLPSQMADILTRKSSSVTFSPDETMVLYTASSSATLAENLIKPLPGASTQKQERNIKEAHTYVYDIKEDRNFLILESEIPPTRRLAWFPTSRHLILAEDAKITIMDYDGTNRQTVYSGSYVAPHSFPFANTGKLLMLTNLGADSNLPNLYSLSLK